MKRRDSISKDEDKHVMNVKRHNGCNVEIASANMENINQRINNIKNKLIIHYLLIKDVLFSWNISNI